MRETRNPLKIVLIQVRSKSFRFFVSLFSILCFSRAYLRKECFYLTPSFVTTHTFCASNLDSIPTLIFVFIYLFDEIFGCLIETDVNKLS